MVSASLGGHLHSVPCLHAHVCHQVHTGTLACPPGGPLGGLGRACPSLCLVRLSCLLLGSPRAARPGAAHLRADSLGTCSLGASVSLPGVSASTAPSVGCVRCAVGTGHLPGTAHRGHLLRSVCSVSGDGAIITNITFCSPCPSEWLHARW